MGPCSNHQALVRFGGAIRLALWHAPLPPAIPMPPVSLCKLHAMMRLCKPRTRTPTCRMRTRQARLTAARRLRPPTLLVRKLQLANSRPGRSVRRLQGKTPRYETYSCKMRSNRSGVTWHGACFGAPRWGARSGGPVPGPIGPEQARDLSAARDAGLVGWSGRAGLQTSRLFPSVLFPSSLPGLVFGFFRFPPLKRKKDRTGATSRTTPRPVQASCRSVIPCKRRA